MKLPNRSFWMKSCKWFQQTFEFFVSIFAFYLIFTWLILEIVESQRIADPLIAFNSESSIPVTHIDIEHTLKILDEDLIKILDKHPYFPFFQKHLITYLVKMKRMDPEIIGKLCSLVSHLKVEQDLIHQVIFKVYMQMEDVKLSDIGQVVMHVLNHSDMKMKAKFRTRLSKIVETCDLATIQIDFKNAVNITRGLRNFGTIWF